MLNCVAWSLLICDTSIALASFASSTPSAAMAPVVTLTEAASPCAGTGYVSEGHPVLVPKRNGGHFTFCTHDKALFADFLANGFCNMEEHSPRSLFSSSIAYHCPNLAAADPRWTLADVGAALLEFVLPVVVAVGFVLGCICALRHARLDPTRRVPLYPRSLARRAVLVLACGLLVALTIVPWLAWAAGVMLYGAVAFVAWPFFGAAMFHTLPSHPLQFWAPFLPLAWRARETLGGVGDVRRLARVPGPKYVGDIEFGPRVLLVGLTEPRPVYIYTRRSRRERRRRMKHCIRARDIR